MMNRIFAAAGLAGISGALLIASAAASGCGDDTELNPSKEAGPLLESGPPPANTVPDASALFTRTLTFKNECPFPVWVGYIGSQASNAACTATSPDETQCPFGQNPSAGRQKCERKGVSGGADDSKCRCASDDQCPAGQRCYVPGGVCQCTDDASCGPGRKCNLAARDGANEIRPQCYWALDTPAGDAGWALPAASAGAPTATATSIPIISPDSEAIVWSGAVFGRTGCTDGTYCATGECGGQSCQPWVGVVDTSPHSRAEFTLKNSFDYYNTSLIHGFNVPLAMAPDPSGPGFVSSADGGFKPNPSFACGDPGVPIPDSGAAAAAWKDLGCKYAFTPPAPSYRLVSEGGAPCATDAECAADGGARVCGLSIKSVRERTRPADGGAPPPDTTCGALLGYWSDDQACAVNKTFPGAPFECDKPVPADAGAYGTHTALYGCEAEDSCYQDNPKATCCGCEDWGAPLFPRALPASKACNAKNAYWRSDVLPRVEFLKVACPMGYTYPFDDESSTFQCTSRRGAEANAAGYVFTFCPGGITGGVAPPPGTAKCTCAPTADDFVVQFAAGNGGQVLDKGGNVVGSSPPKFDDAGAIGTSIAFKWDASKAPYRVVVTRAAKPTDTPVGAGSCTYARNATTGCALAAPAAGETCAAWQTTFGCAIVAPNY